MWVGLHRCIYIVRIYGSEAVFWICAGRGRATAPARDAAHELARLELVDDVASSSIREPGAQPDEPSERRAKECRLIGDKSVLRILV